MMGSDPFATTHWFLIRQTKSLEIFDGDSYDHAEYMGTLRLVK